MRFQLHDHVKLFAMTTYFRAVLSPCIGVCTLNDDGLCDGCHRTSAEIARWPHMSDDERLQLMESVLPDRESHRG
jgi:predicted Fe-S protein YdhL (DUF1289 family)